MFNYVYLALAILAIIGVAVLCTRHKNRRYGIYILAFAFSAYVLAWLIDIGAHLPPEGWRITVFLGSVLVALGWIVSNEISIMNSRRQHTINLIVNLILSQQFISDKQTVRKYLKHYNTPFTEEVASFDDEVHELTLATDRELNLFEFIAIGIKAGDLDDRLIKQCLRSVIINATAQNAQYIAHWRKKIPSNWEHLVEYSDSLK